MIRSSSWSDGSRGDQGAAAEVFRRFAGRLIAWRGTKLDARICRKVDPEDIVQSVYRSFFSRHQAGRFDLATWDSLWSLLTVITVQEVPGSGRVLSGRAPHRRRARST